MQHYIRIVNCRDEVHFVLTSQKRKKNKKSLLFLTGKGVKYKNLLRSLRVKNYERHWFRMVHSCMTLKGRIQSRV
jgi:hypothetical protein